MNLAEKYRPRTLEDVVGQPKAVETVRALIARDAIGGNAFWITGATGTGKTTLARIIAASIADEWGTVEFDAADQLTQAEFDHLSDSLRMRAMGKGGRAIIVNEAHGLRAPIIRQLHGLLERIPPHATFLFTTTREGQDALFEDIEASPLLSRCTRIPLTNQGLSKPFGARLLFIAHQEGLDGLPADHYAKCVVRHHNNLRGAINELLAAPCSGATP